MTDLIHNYAQSAVVTVALLMLDHALFRCGHDNRQNLSWTRKNLRLCTHVPTELGSFLYRIALCLGSQWFQ